jgi:hypothetical protein
MSAADTITPIAPPDPAQRPRAVPVRLALVCTALIFSACAALLIYRGATVDVPDAMLVLRAGVAWDGAEASIDSFTFASPLKATFDRRARYTISYHLRPGTYTLSVRRAGQILHTKELTLDPQEHILLMSLPDTPPEQPSTTAPAWPFSIGTPSISR